MHIAMFGYLTEEGNSSSGNGKRVMWDEIVERQFSKLGSPAILHRSQAVQTRLNMLSIDSFFQSLQFAFQSANLRVVPLKQTRLKPAVEVLNTAIALRTSWRDQERFDAKTQAQAQNTREVFRGRSPANDFAGIVKLHLGRQPQTLPALSEEVQNDFHFARTVDSEAN